MEDEGITPHFLIRDRDRKYPDAFDAFWKSEGVRSIRTPIRAPKANAFAESFIGTIKKECLAHFICFSRDQLDYIIRTWLCYYHSQRPHQGKDIDNRVLDASFTPQQKGMIRRKQHLGGIISYYERDAA